MTVEKPDRYKVTLRYRSAWIPDGGETTWEIRRSLDGARRYARRCLRRYASSGYYEARIYATDEPPRRGHQPHWYLVETITADGDS